MRLLVLCLFSLACCRAWPIAVIWDTFTSNPTFLPGGGSYSIAYGINNSGTVAGVGNPADIYQPVIWQNSAISVLPTGGLGGGARDINNTGDVAGGSVLSGGGYLWSGAVGNQSIGPIAAQAVNDSRQIIGTAIVSGNLHSFEWTATRGAVDIGNLGGPYTTVGDINNSGEITGASLTISGQQHAFIRRGDGLFTDLGTLGGNSSDGNGINDLGWVVGDSLTASGALHGYLWTPADGMLDLGRVIPFAVNNRGEVVGSAFTSQGDRPFIWSMTTGVRLLTTPPGSPFAMAFDINDNGQIVGEADIPEPATELLLLSGGIWAVLLTRRPR